MSESTVKGLLAKNPPFVKLVDESFKPTVFSTNEELMEIKAGVEDLADIPIEAVVEEDVVEEKTIEELLEEAEIVTSPEIYPLQDLEYLVDEAPKGADEIELGDLFKAVQKSGSWYNVFRKDSDEKLNDAGVSRKSLAKFVYELYLEEA